MTAELDLLSVISDLGRRASKVIEESRRLTVEGEALNAAIRETIDRILEISKILGIRQPTILIADAQSTILDDLSDSAYDGETWRLILGKTALADRMRARDHEDTLLFFSIKNFRQWLETIDPFTHPQTPEPDFASATTIRVYGLNHGFGGPLLWVLPVEASAPEVTPDSLPDISDVHGLIHVNASNQSLRVCPRGFALTWGERNNVVAAPLVRMSALVLSACLVQELKRVDGHYEATLRGTKRVSMPLAEQSQSVTPPTLAKLIETVSWVYAERPETRLRLVMDRLSIESQQEDTLLFCMQEYLDAALQQAQDSYTFVILERKDQYHKEMRELMKDMKAQADLYAAKVRDLVTSLTRDILGVLVFIAYSFIGKFDQKNLQGLLASDELSLLVKVITGYLALSCVLQVITHWRDANLAYKESQQWLDSLQNYTSRKDKEETFLALLDKRRFTLYTAMSATVVFYIALVFVIWNLPCIVRCLLAN